ncbi:MAG TPA: SRPBCC family protein [Pyrinomonadaceae bacterium]|nr:SRPBCC family protein [Pyrinomonadaceae bacterium]
MRFIRESLIHATPGQVFAFHERENVLDLLQPPWETARVIQRATIAEIGSRAIIETNVIGPIKTRWIAEHTVYQPPHLFEDVQIKGPFRRWRHRHIITAHPEGATLRDEIEYEPPLGPLGKLVAPWLVEPRLRKLFEYRHQVTRQACEAG